MELFLQVKLDFNKHVRGVQFGTSAQVYKPNTIKNGITSPRTEAAIMLVQIGNRQGSEYICFLGSNTIVTREKWVILPMPEDVVVKKLDVKNSSFDDVLRSRGNVRKRLN